LSGAQDYVVLFWLVGWLLDNSRKQKADGIGLDGLAIGIGGWMAGIGLAAAQSNKEMISE
jgi:hypothetical protein